MTILKEALKEPQITDPRWTKELVYPIHVAAATGDASRLAAFGVWGGGLRVLGMGL